MDGFGWMMWNKVKMIMKGMRSVWMVVMVGRVIGSLYGMKVDIEMEGVGEGFGLIVCLWMLVWGRGFVILGKIKWL